MYDLREIVGRKLKRARLEQNLTQQQLANQLNYVRQYICLLEGGKKPVDVNKLLEFSKVLKKPITYFINENEQ